MTRICISYIRRFPSVLHSAQTQWNYNYPPSDFSRSNSVLVFTFKFHANIYIYSGPTIQYRASCVLGETGGKLLINIPGETGINAVLVSLRRIPNTRKVKQAIETTFDAAYTLHRPSSYHYRSFSFHFVEIAII